MTCSPTVCEIVSAEFSESLFFFFVSTSTLLKRGDGVFYGKNPGTYQAIPDALLPIPISTKDDVSASLAEHFKPIDFCSPSHYNGFYLCSYFHTRDVSKWNSQYYGFIFQRHYFCATEIVPCSSVRFSD